MLKFYTPPVLKAPGRGWSRRKFITLKLKLVSENWNVFGISGGGRISTIG